MKHITINLNEFFEDEELELSNTTSEYIKEIIRLLLTKDDEWLERFYIRLRRDKIRV